MSFFVLLFAAGFALAMILWQLCGQIDDPSRRAAARSAAVALLCTPSLLFGHGVGLMPGVVAIALQPSPFSIVPVLVVGAVTFVILMSSARLRDERRTGFSLAAVFVPAHPFKLLVAGLVAYAVLRSASIAWFAHPAAFLLQPALLVAAAYLHFAICRAVARERPVPVAMLALPFALPALLFSLRVLLVGAIVALVQPLTLYVAGLAGALAARGRFGAASWLAGAAHLAYAAYAAYLAFYAGGASTPAYVPGGVWGNLALAACLVALGSMSVWKLRQMRNDAVGLPA